MSIYKQTHAITRPAYLGGGSWNLKRLTDISVVMGKNGSGKSILMRAWRDQEPNNVHYIIPERTGDIQYQAQYITEEFDGTKRGSTYSKNYVTEYRRRIIGRVQSYFMHRGNYRGAAPPPGAPDEIEVLLSTLIPEFYVTLRADTPPYTLTRNATAESVPETEQLSSGEAQLFTIGLDILTISAIWEIQNQPTRILLIDEPDAHIHPDLQARFSEFLCKLSDRFSLQIVISTHSTSLMSAIGQYGDEKASVIYLSRDATELVAKPLSGINRELAACLGGHVLMGVLFGAPILLVEGDDDQQVWSQVPRHHQLNLAVIPCNGTEIKKYQRHLETIFSCLYGFPNAPLGFALLDGDKSLPQDNSGTPQKYVRFIKLDCHETENLYLTENVLGDLGLTWGSASDQIIANADQFGSKAAELKRCKEWNRKTADIKLLIDEIAQILDPKKVSWKKRIGVCIGSSRPSGEILDFLGTSVVDSLWPSTQSIQ